MQSNTRVGDIPVLAGEDLTGKEGCLVKLTHDTQVPEVLLPTAADDYAIYALVEAGEDADLVTVRPLATDRNVRLRLNGTCNPGDVIVPETTGNLGKVRALPTAAGTYRGIGIAEEAGVDEQLVLVRPYPLGNITVSA